MGADLLYRSYSSCTNPVATRGLQGAVQTLQRAVFIVQLNVHLRSWLNWTHLCVTEYHLLTLLEHQLHPDSTSCESPYFREVLVVYFPMPCRV